MDMQRNYIERPSEMLNLEFADLSRLKPAPSKFHNMTKEQRGIASMALEIAIRDRYDGNNSWFANECGLYPSATREWVIQGMVPAWRVMEVVDLLNHSLARPEILRPDVFREPQDAGPLKDYVGRRAKTAGIRTQV